MYNKYSRCKATDIMTFKEQIKEQHVWKLCPRSCLENCCIESHTLFNSPGIMSALLSGS